MKNQKIKALFIATFTSLTLLTACTGGSGNTNSTTSTNSSTVQPEVDLTSSTNGTTSCINATITSDNQNSGYNTIRLSLTNTCQTEQSLSGYRVNLTLQDIALNNTAITTFNNSNVNNVAYNLNLENLSNNQYTGLVTASNSKPIIAAGQTIQLSASKNLNDPFDMFTARKTLTINGNSQYPEYATAPEETDCLSAAINYSTNNPKYTSGNITFVNKCKYTVKYLDNALITFKSQDITSAKVVLGNLKNYINNKNYFLNFTTDANNTLIGTSTSSTSRPYIQPGQTIVLNGDAQTRTTYDLDTAQQTLALNNAKQYPEVATIEPVPGCISATIDYSTSSAYYTTGTIVFTNNCGSNQFLDTQVIKIRSEDIATRPVVLNALSATNTGNIKYQMSFTSGTNNTLIGKITSDYSRPVILKDQKVTFTGDAKLLQPFNLKLAQQSFMLDSLYQYPREVPTLIPDDCVSASIKINGTTNYVPYTISLINKCNVVQSLKNSVITLKAQNTKLQALDALKINNTYLNNTNFTISCNVRSVNNQYCTINSSDGYPFIYANQTLNFDGGINIGKDNIIDSTTLLATIDHQEIGIVATTPAKSDGSNNTLLNIPTTAIGRKTLTFVNNASQSIKLTQITPMYQLPTDITLNTSRTTCKVNMILNDAQSCDIVYDYKPKYEGVNSAIGISIAGTGTNDNAIYTNTVNMPYSSRITTTVFKGLPDNVTYNKQGLVITKTPTVSWANNQITNIPVGSFGLVSYTLTNTTDLNQYAVTITPSKVTGEGLANGLTFDDTRTTCGLTNKFMLKPQQSCTVVLKYLPTTKGETGTVNLNFKTVDDWYNYSTVASDVAIPYTSRK